MKFRYITAPILMFDIREYLYPVGLQVPQAKSRYKVGIEPQSLLAPFHSYYFLTIFFLTLMIFLVPRGPGNPLQCSCLENPMGGEAW